MALSVAAEARSPRTLFERHDNSLAATKATLTLNESISTRLSYDSLDFSTVHE
jgi:hypothetical protein